MIRFVFLGMGIHAIMSGVLPALGLTALLSPGQQIISGLLFMALAGTLWAIQVSARLWKESRDKGVRL